MALIKWSKISKIIAPNNNLINNLDYVLIYSLYGQASLIQKTNYSVIKEQLDDIIEYNYNNKNFLLLPSQSSNLLKAQNMILKINKFEILDEEKYLREFKKEQEIQKRIGKCSLCFQDLDFDFSNLSVMGPVCEHKTRLIESGKESINLIDNFKSYGAINPKKGDCYIFKIKQDEKNNYNMFAEILEILNGFVFLIDRQLYFKSIQNLDINQSFKISVKTIAIHDILGIQKVMEQNSNIETLDSLLDDFLDMFGESYE